MIEEEYHITFVDKEMFVVDSEGRYISFDGAPCSFEIHFTCLAHPWTKPLAIRKLKRIIRKRRGKEPKSPKITEKSVFI